MAMGTEEPDINLKSKSLFDTARKVQDDVLALSLTTGSTAATDLFTSELERKLGVAGRPRGATAAPLLISSPEIATSSTTREDGMPSSEAPRLAARSRIKQPLKLVKMILYSSELEASRLRSRHGSGDARSRAIFHDSPRKTASKGEYTHFSHIIWNSSDPPPPPLQQMLAATALAQINMPVIFNPSWYAFHMASTQKYSRAVGRCYIC